MFSEHTTFSPDHGILHLLFLSTADFFQHAQNWKKGGIALVRRAGVFFLHFSWVTGGGGDGGGGLCFRGGGGGGKKFDLFFSTFSPDHGILYLLFFPLQIFFDT